MKKLILFTISLLAIFSCSENYIEKVVLKHPNNTPSYVEYYKTTDSAEVLAKIVRFYFNGEKQEETYLENGEKNGKSTMWHLNGEKMYECFYKDDVYDSTFVQWYEDGTLEYEAVYDMGMPTGTWKFYKTDGSLQSEKKFE